MSNVFILSHEANLLPSLGLWGSSGVPDALWSLYMMYKNTPH